MDDTRHITILLNEAEAGREGALDELMQVVYSDLERMAAKHLHRQFGDRVQAVTLEPAALVNESFMKLIRQRNTYDNRGQFFAIATKVMLRVLIDYQRSRSAEKRGGGRSKVTLAFDDQIMDNSPSSHLIDPELLQDALSKLDGLDPRTADVVRMKVIWGLTIPEMAESLEISETTIKDRWRFARAWLANEIGSM